jgi:predicted ribosomally synthesized peptide with nif11-like leader
MSLESANEFISATRANPALMSKVAQAITGKSTADAAQAVSELGLINGFEFSGQEAIQAHQALLNPQSLSEDELDHVAGGAAQLGMGNPAIGISGELLAHIPAGDLMPRTPVGRPPIIPIFPTLPKESKTLPGGLDPAAGW